MRLPLVVGFTLLGLLSQQTLAAQTGCVAPAEACAFFDRYLAAFNQRDWEAFRATFDDSITVLFDVPAPPQRRDGRAAVEELFQRVFPPLDQRPRRLPPPISPIDLRVQDYGQVVVVTFHIGGGDELARRTVVLHRGSNGWRVVHIHASSGVPTPR